MYSISHMYLIYWILPIASLLYVIYQRHVSPLARFPGPFLASISRLWITWTSWKGVSHSKLVYLHEKYGKIVRIGPNELSIADIDAFKKVYAAGTKFRKSDWYSVWQGRRKFDLFAERDERIHAAHRKLVSRAYAMDSLKDLEEYVDRTIGHFCAKMEEQSGKSLDLGVWLQLFAFDVIGEITFSKEFGFLKDGNDNGTFQTIEMASRSASWIGQIPWLYWLNDWVTPVIGNQLAIAARHGSLRAFAVSEVEKRKNRGSDRKDFLGKFFEIQEAKPKEFDMTALASMATSNIFAGSDTTAISLRSIIFNLLKNSRCRLKLVEELDTAYGEGRLSMPPSLKQVNALPYLQACLYEASRCHPVIGMTIPRVVPAGGFDIAGSHLPKGIVIGACPWVIHRSKEIYGEDADSFRPERWLVEDTTEMNRCFFSFGAGARLCIGKNISWMEMSKLIPTLFFKYDLRLTDASRELEVKAWWFTYQKGLDVILQPRNLNSVQD